MQEKYENKAVYKYSNGQSKMTNDPVVKEFPLTLFINNKEIVTMVCSPQDLKELGVGFLLSEGIINNIHDIDSIELQEKEGLINFAISNLSTATTDGFLRRNIASCCGKGRAGLFFINDAKQVKAIESECMFEVDFLLKLMTIFENNSKIFHLTGGVHSSSLAKKSNSANDSLLLSYEDIGRHNAVDKVMGGLVLQSMKTEDKCLLLSGRISSEIVIKAARASIPLVISKASPTDLAVDLAEDLNITIIGFARKERLNIYSHSQRVIQ